MDVEFQGIVVEYGKTRVLHQVYGRAKCGHILGIIGASGAGKTSLLNVIAGRIKPTSGSVTISDKKATKQLRRHIAYVTQEDVFFPHITLRETLMFSAMLKLPESMTYKEKCERVQSLVEQFDLTKCTDTIMGGVMVRGLSGGERKRANIACEMINNVDIIILDEPTSGLDSVTAHQVMSLLQTYAEREQKTVITTLHQPNSRIFHMCEDILVLSSGQVACNEPRDNIIQFLANIGFHCPSYYNPADFILEKLKESKDSETRIIEASLASSSNSKGLIEEPSHQPAIGQVNLAFDPEIKVSIDRTTKEDIKTMKWKTGFLTQFRMLCRRHLKQIAGSFINVTMLLLYLVMSLIVGILWFQIPHTVDNITYHVGLIFFCQLFFGFKTKEAALASFHMEKTVVIREQAAGMYRLSAYYLSKFISQLVLSSLEPILFYIFVYWMAGLSSQPWIFICSLLILQVSLIAASGIGTFLAILLDDLGTALAVASNLYILQFILAGFLVVNDTKWFHWTKYLSVLYFATSASSKLEFIYGSGLSLSDTQDANSTICTEYDTAAAFESRLQESLPIWLDVLLLVCYITFYWLGGYVILRWKKRHH